MIGIAIALAIALGAAWVLVEIAMPLVLFLVYWVMMKAIGRAANDRHECWPSTASIEAYSRNAFGFAELETNFVVRGRKYPLTDISGTCP